MTTYQDYQKLLFSYNFTGIAPNTNSVPGIILGKEDGRYIVTYSTLNNPTDVSALGYYPIDSAEELGFATSSYNSLINTRLETILSASNPNDSRMLFSDVAMITFDSTDGNSNGTFDSGEAVGIVTFGQIKSTYSGYPGNFTPATNAFTIPYERLPNSNIHGDVWFNVDNSVWNEQAGNGYISLGDSSYKILLEETMHTLGVDVLHNINNVDPILDTQKYTVTSYNLAQGMNAGLQELNVSAYSLQLYDIAALQEIYGRNYQKAAASGTVWNLAAMNYSSDYSDAFLYTIWDGGGLNDIIDVSQFNTYSNVSGVEIDLRQGRFSSIGDDVYGNPIAKDTQTEDFGNVAIAYHTIIEDATGSKFDDKVIGNAWNNILRGGDGNDLLYGDGIAYDGNAGFTTIDASDPNDPNRGKPLSDNDTLIGGAGSDSLNGGAGVDTADYSANGQGITVTKSGTPVSVNEGGGDVDTLLNMEVIKGTGSDDTFTFTTLPTSLSKIDAGGGYDTLSFSSLGFGVSVFEKTADEFKLYDTNAQRSYEYSNIEDVTVLPLGTLILDDKATSTNYSTLLQQYFGGVAANDNTTLLCRAA